MLILSRKRGEAITIGSGITITILAVHAERVKLGVAAPAAVPVHRQEVYRRLGPRPPALAQAECA
jgi:carbon storage regulator